MLQPGHDRCLKPRTRPKILMSAKSPTHGIRYSQHTRKKDIISKRFSLGEPLDMIEVFTDNGWNQVRTRTNDEATDSRRTSNPSEAQDQSCKNSHGVETYKFFQNWLRVPDAVPLPAYIPGNRVCAVMGNGPLMVHRLPGLEPGLNVFTKTTKSAKNPPSQTAAWLNNSPNPE